MNTSMQKLADTLKKERNEKNLKAKNARRCRVAVNIYKRIGEL